jgi:hypothetical protein
MRAIGSSASESAVSIPQEETVACGRRVQASFKNMWQPLRPPGDDEDDIGRVDVEISKGGCDNQVARPTVRSEILRMAAKFVRPPRDKTENNQNLPS